MWTTVVPLAGIEPTTFPLGEGRSILLSYRGGCCGHHQRRKRYQLTFFSSSGAHAPGPRATGQQHRNQARRATQCEQHPAGDGECGGKGD